MRILLLWLHPLPLHGGSAKLHVTSEGIFSVVFRAPTMAAHEYLLSCSDMQRWEQIKKPLYLHLPQTLTNHVALVGRRWEIAVAFPEG